MKIFIKTDLSGKKHDEVTEGLADASAMCGFETSKWDEGIKPAYDMLYESNPDVIICRHADLTEALRQGCEEKKVKLVSINPTELTGNNILAYVHRPSANLSLLSSHEKVHEIVTVTEKVLPEIHHFSDFNLRCFSLRSRLQIPNFLGTVSPGEAAEEVSKSKAYLETQNKDENILNAAVNFTFPIFLGRSLIPDSILGVSNTIEDARNLLQEVLKETRKVSETLRQVRDYVLENRTYFHRLHDIMNLIECSKEAQKCNETLESLK